MRKEKNLVRETFVRETCFHLKWVVQTDFMQVVAMLRRGCLVDLWDKNLLSTGNRQTEGIDKQARGAHVTCGGNPRGSGGWE